LDVGNHDQGSTGNGGVDSSTSFYNQYFGVSRFSGRSYYGGYYGSDNNNHYELFSASGMDFLVVNLEWDENVAHPEFITWANSIHVQTFSPTLNQFENTSAGDFTFTYPMQGPGNGFPCSGGCQFLRARRLTLFGATSRPTPPTIGMQRSMDPAARPPALSGHSQRWARPRPLASRQRVSRSRASRSTRRAQRKA